jgi:hypothetical protein
MPVIPISSNIKHIDSNPLLDGTMLARINKALYGPKPQLRVVSGPDKACQDAPGSTLATELIPTYTHITPNATGSLVVDTDTIEAWTRERSRSGRGEVEERQADGLGTTPNSA